VTVNTEDVLLLLGIFLVAFGLYFMGWPLAVIWAGLVVGTAGAVRLWIKARRPGRGGDGE
jgi:hypothetical protein